VGKGTQCARLAQDLGFQHLSVGDLLREEIHQLDSPFATFISESIQSSVIIPAQLTVNLLKAKMSASKTQGKSRFLIDGYPRSMDQALMFEEEVLNIPSSPVVLAPKFL
jgi:UMP-CMP kinase